MAAVGTLALALAACQSMGAGAEPPVVDSMPAPTSAAPPPPPPPPPPVYLVRSGSPSVLAKFPRGSEVSRDTRICLEEGEQITIAGTNGQQVSYRGPGCMQRTGRPTGDNEGGFIFGFNDFAEPTQEELAR